jgi:UDP-N-acetyl-D-mannosaminuronic acid transferase (WecB/TagA/CpsF family)
MSAPGVLRVEGGEVEAGAREKNYRVLGVRVDAVQIGDVVERMEEWIGRGERGKYIAVTGMHGVMEAQHEEGFKRVLREADLVVADGYPLAWLGRRKGYGMKRRVYGPELMEAFCERSAGDLAAKVEWAWKHPEEMEKMGKAARGEYEAKYTAEKNYGMLMEVYERAIAARRLEGVPGAGNVRASRWAD